MLANHEIQALADKISEVFTPSTPVQDHRFLRGRDRVLLDINDAIARVGSSIVVYGERGVGKSSIARVVSQFAPGQTFYYSASNRDTFETITAAILNGFDVAWTPESRETSTTTALQGTLDLPGLNAGGKKSQSRTSHEGAIQTKAMTSQEVVRRLPANASLIIVDEFERLPIQRDREDFAELIKKLADNGSRATLMLVGIAANVNELLAAHESAERSVAEIHVPRLLNDEIRSIVTGGFEELGVEIDPLLVEQIVDFSANFPYYTHLLCEGAARSLVEHLHRTGSEKIAISPADINNAVTHAIRNARQSISSMYEDAIRSLHESNRFKYTLYAIASWPEEPVAYKHICEWVGSLVHGREQSVNVSHQLCRLETLKVIEKPSKGFYRFKDPLLKAYVILRSRADTPDAELREIDNQLERVKRQLARVRERIGH